MLHVVVLLLRQVVRCTGGMTLVILGAVLGRRMAAFVTVLRWIRVLDMSEKE
jgi:hypothetical protein